MSLQAVRCALEPEAAGAACTRRTLPPGVSLSLGRAEAAIEGAQQAPSVKRTRNGVRSAVRLMDAAARSVRRAETGHSIDGDCARVLRGMLRDARARARRYLKNGPERAAAIAVRRVALVS